MTAALELSPSRLNLKLPWVLKADGTWGGHGVRIAYSWQQGEQCFLNLSGHLSTVRFIKRALVNRDPYWLEGCVATSAGPPADNVKES